MSLFLLAIRGLVQFGKNGLFLLANRLRFEAKNDALKSMISQS
jgi:hypothetical protein